MLKRLQIEAEAAAVIDGKFDTHKDSLGASTKSKRGNAKHKRSNSEGSVAPAPESRGKHPGQ